jgi:ferredoxin-NADP reductase
MKLTLEDKVETVPGIITFVFYGDEMPTWLPGQYLRYTLPHDNPDDRGTRRWFTIAAPPYEERVKITTRVLEEKGSSFKKALLAMPIGSEIEAGPAGGDFIFDESRPAVLIAGGIGVTPYRAMLLELDHNKKDFQATLLYANRDDNYPFQSEFEDIAARHAGLKITYFTDPQKIEPDDVTAAAMRYEKPLYYISGPEPMVGHFEKLLTDSGVPETDIKTDYFPGYES